MPRFLSWVFAYAVLSKASPRSYLVLEVGFSLLYFLLMWFFLKKMGVYGVGIANTASYVFYFILAFCIAIIETNIIPNWRMLVTSILAVVAALVGSFALLKEDPFLVWISILLGFFVCIFAIFLLRRRVILVEVA